VLALAEPNGASVKWICVDAPAIGDVDYTGGETIIQVDKGLEERGVRLVLAGVGQEIRAELDRAGVTDVVGTDAYYASVVDVLQAYRAGAK
jgi:sulfate permease, SulP family